MENKEEENLSYVKFFEEKYNFHPKALSSRRSAHTHVHTDHIIHMCMPFQRNYATCLSICITHYTTPCISRRLLQLHPLLTFQGTVSLIPSKSG